MVIIAYDFIKVTLSELSHLDFTFGVIFCFHVFNFRKRNNAAALKYFDKHKLHDKLSIRLRVCMLELLPVSFKYRRRILGKEAPGMASWVQYFALKVFRLLRKLPLFKILRVGTSTKMFVDYFKGFENSSAVRGIFGEKTEEMLRTT